MKKIPIILIVSCLALFGAEEDAQSSMVKSQMLSLAQSLAKSIPEQEEKVAIAVLDFATSKGTANVQQLGKAMALVLNESFSEDSRFTVVDRANVEKLAKEIALGQTGLVDEASAAKAGEMVGAKIMVTGSVAELGEYFVISARAVSVETAEIVSSGVIEIRQDNMIALSSEYVVIRKYAIVPAIQSAIIPGWGQIYNDQVGKGGMFIGVGLLSGITYAGSLMYWFIQTDRYNSAVDESPGRQDVQDEFETLEKVALVNRVAAGTTIGIWSLAALDAFIVARRQLKKLKKKEGPVSVLPRFHYEPEEGSYAGEVALTLRF